MSLLVPHRLAPRHGARAEGVAPLPVASARPGVRSSGGATFSPCRSFRYHLWRTWNTDRSPLLFVMLNPSKADEERSDRTISRCAAFARRLGRGGLEVVNLYAYRATDPRHLRDAGYLVGEQNDATIFARASAHAGLPIVCGWGWHARNLRRAAEVLQLIRSAGAIPHALAFTGDGIPRHPLTLRSDCTLVPLSCRDEERETGGSRQ